MESHHHLSPTVGPQTTTIQRRVAPLMDANRANIAPIRVLVRPFVPPTKIAKRANRSVTSRWGAAWIVGPTAIVLTSRSVVLRCALQTRIAPPVSIALQTRSVTPRSKNVWIVSHRTTVPRIVAAVKAFACFSQPPAEAAKTANPFDRSVILAKKSVWIVLETMTVQRPNIVRTTYVKKMSVPRERNAATAKVWASNLATPEAADGVLLWLVQPTNIAKTITV